MKYSCTIILVYCSFLLLNAQPINYRFDNFSIDNGLPHNVVSSVTQDQLGFIWISTEGGLARYDGHQFKVFRHNPTDSTTLPTNACGKIHQLSNGHFFFHKPGYSFLFDPISEEVTKLQFASQSPSVVQVSKDASVWIGTFEDGLYHYDSSFNLQKHYLHQKYSKNSLTNDKVRALFEDQEGNIWVSLRSGGLNKIDRRSNQLFRFPFLEEKDGIIAATSTTLNTGRIFCFNQFESSSIWMGTVSGLVELNLSTQQFTHYRYADFDLKNANTSAITALHYHQGYLWCGTVNKGIWIFDVTNKRFIQNYKTQKHTPNSLASNRILSFFNATKFEDGSLWVSTLKGVSKVDLQQKAFELYTDLSFADQRVDIHNLRAIYSDANNLWLGGNEKSNLNIFSKQKGEITGLRTTFTEGTGAIGSITKRPDGNYWITTWMGSLTLFDPSQMSWTSWQSYYNDIGLEGWVFCEAAIDQLGNFWISSLREGLLKLPATSKHFDPIITSSPNGLPDNVIRAIFIDESDEAEIIWLGTDSGLSKYNSKTNTFKNYFQDIEVYPNLYCNKITSIYKDQQGLFWLGMDGCGLVRFNLLTQEIKNYTVEDGLCSNAVLSVYEDSNGYLWMSTVNGISKFNPLKETFKNYYKADGLQSNQFNWGAHFQDEEGKLYFGGPEGLTAFHPQQIRDNPYSPQVIFTGLFIRNQLVAPQDTINGKVILSNNLNTLKTLNIHHLNNDFSIEFAATHFAAPSQVQYKYKLEGYDQDWRYTDAKNRRAVYSNLEAGNYTFQVLASNNDGIWGKVPKQLAIKIIPPWWNTIQFRFFILVLLIALAIAYLKLRTYRYQIQQEKLERLVDERTAALTQAKAALEIRQEALVKQKAETEEMAQKVHQADQMKLNFLTNISHEFRTPLTLILGPITQLLHSKEDTTHQRNFYPIIHRNAQRLLRLINQFLDLSYVETGSLKLHVKANDIVAFVQRIADAFQFEAEQNGIQFELSLPNQAVTAYFDADKLDKILYNLLSNAFKFTGAGGKVRLQMNISTSPKMAQIKVVDTGIGIEKEALPKIFDRFYQVKQGASYYAGTGIGLALTKKLVEQHKGSLEVESEKAKGSCMSVTFPINPMAYTKEELFASSNQLKAPIKSSTQPTTSPIYTYHTNDFQPSTPSKINLLFVDDNLDLTFLVEKHFTNQFNISLASNGKEALKIIQSNPPDIIVSDLMMPLMNGIELCRAVKENAETDHIPFILLTAKANWESELEGFNSGAEDYMVKPFNLEGLGVKIQNLLRQQQKLVEKILKAPEVVQTKKKKSTPQKVSFQESFLRQVVESVYAQINDSQINTDKLAAALNMSKSTLYRKLKQLTGQTINDFIKNIQLQEAAKRLRTTTNSISEIAYSVGFNNHNYFTRCFVNQFSCTPTEYRKASHSQSE